jgi:small subunit ribosomal protein S30
VVHPSTEVVDCLLKYQWLTGTSIVPHLPDSYEDLPTPETSLIEDFKGRLEEYLIMAQDDLVCEKGENWWRAGINFGLFQAVLPSIWSLAPKYPHIISSYWSTNTKIECYWRRHGMNFITFGHPLGILRTPKSLELPVAPDEPVGEPCPSTDLHPTTHIRIFQRSFDQITVYGGSKCQSAFNLAHTLVIQDRSKNTPEQTKAHGLMELFAQSAAQTVQNGFPLDQDLHYPLYTQGIITNGQDYTFVSYQLNTLNLTKDNPSDLHNVYWIGPTYSLYERTGPSSVTVNDECACMIVKFFLNRTSRNAPLHSGFKMAELANIEKERLRSTRKRVDLRYVKFDELHKFYSV